MTTTEAAKKLCVTPRRVRALIASGRLRAERIGRDWHIMEADLDALGERKPGRPKGEL